MEKPVLTFPEDVADWVCAHYAEADVILEYGSGGSTVYGSEMEGKTIYSVESDADWATNLQHYLDRSPETRSHPLLQHVDVGKVGRWGRPVDNTGWRQYHKYPVSIWDRENFVQPELVLVDGLFRVACVLTTMVKTKATVELLFDDFMNPREDLKTVRPRWQALLDFIEPVEIKGRMAKFIIEPQSLPPEHFATALAMFFRRY
ncbi:hypothetical protein [Chachezhania antarctica]|uniref:hypothetical protein n=1 Tax=Chachezhania antarctica TaxID=2340860 RepID=UPI000EAB53A5|nr:hypothetical protein [Chachezhania antarctica]|tara:strand:+ start:1792 stop:2400 length:609 start_codon:yes stop_codon:yes gene_type:complete